MIRSIVILLFVTFLFNNGVSATDIVSRQRRCIVIQKQTGGRADSLESGDDEDYDYKRPQPKNPGLDRLQAPRVESPGSKTKGDVEAVSPELLNYKAPPLMSMFRKLNLRDRFRKIFQ